MVLLAGEPGIGKSRLLAALRERLAGRAARARCSYLLLAVSTRTARSTRSSTSSSARPGSRATTPPERKLDKLEALLAPTARDRRETVALAGRAAVHPGRRPLSRRLELSPQRQKERTLEALVDQLAALGPAQPVLMVFEDVHWIDPTTLELLDLVVERVARPAGAAGGHLPAGVQPALDRPAACHSL